MKTRGWGPWRADFYSICSKHRTSREDCPQCQAGSWRNRIVHRIDCVIWGRFPRFALWWNNRPNSKARRDIERIFPNLRRKPGRTAP